MVFRCSPHRGRQWGTASKDALHILQVQGHLVKLVQIQPAEEALGQIFHASHTAQVIGVVDDGHGADVRALQDLPHLVEGRILVDGGGRASDDISDARAQVRDEQRRPGG